jgi:hypothetical protein
MVIMLKTEQEIKALLSKLSKWKGDQVLAMREINEEYALRVVYERRNGIIIVITFYPVKRKEYGI